MTLTILLTFRFRCGSVCLCWWRHLQLPTHNSTTQLANQLTHLFAVALHTLSTYTCTVIMIMPTPAEAPHNERLMNTGWYHQHKHTLPHWDLKVKTTTRQVKVRFKTLFTQYSVWQNADTWGIRLRVFSGSLSNKLFWACCNPLSTKGKWRLSITVDKFAAQKVFFFIRQKKKKKFVCPFLTDPKFGKHELLFFFFFWYSILHF